MKISNVRNRKKLLYKTNQYFTNARSDYILNEEQNVIKKNNQNRKKLFKIKTMIAEMNNYNKRVESKAKNIEIEIKMTRC